MKGFNTIRIQNLVVKWIASVFPAACCRVKRANIKK